jgi:hypothetical protein
MAPPRGVDASFATAVAVPLHIRQSRTFKTQSQFVGRVETGIFQAGAGSVGDTDSAFLHTLPPNPIGRSPEHASD